MHDIPLLPRMLVIWLAIFPLVLGAQTVVSPFTENWPNVLSLALTIALVVPTAVLIVFPIYTKIYFAIFPPKKPN